MSSAPVLRIKGVSLAVEGTLVMGVVNASPDSFSDGRATNIDAQRARCDELVAAGADIIDIGGQSAITNRPEVEAELEAALVAPLVEWMVAEHPDVLVSVDTYKPRVVDAVLDAGASIINDVSGLLYPEIVSSVVRHDAALVIMHTAAKPKVRRQDPELYADVVGEVRDFLAERLARVIELGLPRESVILDPGPDFTKTPHQTVELLRGIEAVRELGRPVLLALSRKDFLGAITGRSPRGRDAATAAAVAFFAGSPGNIVRVHDVAAARDAVATVEVLSSLRDIPRDYLLPDTIRHEPQQ
ncbi:MAG TPA: dihydropteroate synthase [Aeromicrobium sp.]|nr:dihydropteroate synthase [Aeromicrobium sp.]HKY58101.1 dihydropteroate synthase [Aeromicrobium sp.]